MTYRSGTRIELFFIQFTNYFGFSEEIIGNIYGKPMGKDKSKKEKGIDNDNLYVKEKEVEENTNILFLVVVVAC